ncbi:MAG TPA: response regulator [Candidatus Obscuribacterales bacterium]
MKILLIEDEQPLREDILETLECMYFDVIGAENGLVGVQLALQHKPDLIICDIMMPKLDGYDVLKTLRQNPETSHIPFIFLSAKTEKADIQKGRDLGANDYLTKPFTIAQLSQAISAQLLKREKIE